MAIIFASSCTVISSKQLVKAVSATGPVGVSPQHFQSFWDSWWRVFVKGYHVLEYAVLTALLMRPFKGRIGWIAVFALLYASSDEFHQTFVAGRGGKWTDVAIYSLGIAMVSLIALVIQVRGRAAKSNMVSPKRVTYPPES